MLKTSIIVILVIISLILVYLLFSGKVDNILQRNNQNNNSQSSNQSANTQTSSVTPKELSITLSEQNSSGESGTALLKEVDSKVIVTLSLNGAPKDIPQPTHIHIGACPKPGAVKYPLANVMNGNSETTIELTMEQLKQGVPLAVNVHKSAAEPTVFVACGDIKF